MKITFELQKMAQKKGGDRYSAMVNGEEMVVYFPQSISRVANVPRKVITVTVEV